MPSAQHNRMSGMTLIALCGAYARCSLVGGQEGPYTVTKASWTISESTTAPSMHRTRARPSAAKCFTSSFREGLPTTTPSIPAFPPTARTLTMRSRTRLWMSFDATEQRVGTRPWRNFVANRVPWWSATSANGDYNMVPIKLPDGQKLQFSPGKHNEVQKAIIEEFAPRFAPGAHLLYLGDTAKKNCR